MLPSREAFTCPNTKQLIDSLHCDYSGNLALTSQDFHRPRERVMDSMCPLLSVYIFSFTFSKGLLFRPPPKEYFYRNSLAACEARSALRSGLIPFLAVFSERRGEAPGPVCSSREETRFISFQPHPSRPEMWLRYLKDPRSSVYQLCL